MIREIFTMSCKFAVLAQIATIFLMRIDSHYYCLLAYFKCSSRLLVATDRLIADQILIASLCCNLEFYDCTDGPFAVTCERNGQTTYWKVGVGSDEKQVIMGTKSKNEASIFYIEKQVRPGVFNITHYGEQVLSDAKKTPSKYLSVKSRLTGSDEGPLQIRGKRAAYFVLKHPTTKKRDDLTTEFWESHSCCIRLAPRKLQKKTYVAFDWDANKTLYTRSERGGITTRFRLSRIGIEHARARASLGPDIEGTLRRVQTPSPIHTRTESDCGDKEPEEPCFSSMARQIQHLCGECDREDRPCVREEEEEEGSSEDSGLSDWDDADEDDD